MTSKFKLNILETSPKMENEVLHYYTGRVRAFWKDKIFFSDQRNVAVVNVQDLYLHGKQADTKDIPNLEALVTNSEWDEAPEFHSYVSEYPNKDQSSWPFQLSGKSRWQARYAWIGPMPEFIGKDCQNDIVYMPVSYYTGMVIRHFDDKILFGDTRNNVMVNIVDFYISGKRASKKEASKALNDLDPLIHAYITKLKVLANTRIIGPEPQLPTWPKQHYASDTWVAKFAWQGEMPQVVRDQVGRYRIIRMNEWDSIGRIPWRKDDQVERLNSQAEIRKEYQWEKYFTNNEDMRSSAKVTLNSSFVPVEQEAGIMKGSLLLANHQQALMTSFVDVITFTKENFYINGEKFRSHMSLSDFFQSRKIPLSAWVVPLAKPKVIFHINVVWYAVCVWCGNIPKNLEDIKRQYGVGKWTGNIMDTCNFNSTKKFTHFMGNITNLSFASGVLKSRVSPRHTVKISFKRKALYMYGYKFHSSCSLLDKQQILESYTWSVLAYPVSSENHVGNLQYHAIALWQYQYQHFIMMDIFQRIVTEANDPKNNIPNDSSNSPRENSLGSEELGRHLSGWIVNVSQNYGIIQSGSTQMEATCLYFHKSVLYLDGELLPKHVTLNSIDKYRQCNMYAKPTPSKDIDGFIVTMEAVMVWIGKKPSLLGSPPREVTCEINSLDTDLKPTHNLKSREVDNKISPAENNSVEDFQTDKYPGLTCNKEDSIVGVNAPHAVESVITGSVLVSDNCQGLLTWFENIVAFSRKIFYIDGEKFEDTYNSLAGFFIGNKVTLRAWIVPLKEPKIVFNCRVMYEALCVWTGQEPADLKNLKTEKSQGILIKGSENSDKSTIPKVVFTYFVGKVTHLTLHMGLITCKTDKGNTEVAFWDKSLFINGARVHDGSNLKSYSIILTLSLWSVLAFPITPKEFQGKTVRYCAVAVWHHNDQHKIGRELLFGTSSKVKDLASDILSLDMEKPTSVGDMVPVVTDSVDKFMSGVIVTARDRCGIIKCISDKPQEYTYVLFHRSVIWIDGQAVTTDLSTCLSDRSSQCSLYAHPTSKEEIDGYQITMIASVVWFGEKPYHIVRPGSSEEIQIPSEIEQKTVTQVEEVKKKLEKMSLQDLSTTVLQTSQEGSGAGKTLDQSGNEEIGHKYVGKHITGRIIDKCKGGGVAQWHSIQLEGEVYIEFSRKNISIDLSPMNKKTKLSVLQARPCNFYVIPVPHREVCGYTVSLEATCGWIGSKPSHIPSPGTQELAKVDLSSVHVTPVDKSCCNGKSPNEHSQSLADHRTSHNFQSGCGSLGSGLQKTVKHAQPEAMFEDKDQIPFMNGQPQSKNEFHAYVAEDALNSMLNIPTISVKSYTENFNQSNSELWEEGSKKSHMRGTIVELHSYVGRLQGADGSQHYFSRDHCYLYGVNLRNVELWHVLVQGEEAIYTTSEITPGTVKVQGVWVGALKVDDVQKAAAYIYEWCKKNLVPDGARDLLVHQLEVS